MMLSDSSVVMEERKKNPLGKGDYSVSSVLSFQL
jgi:hypothetical protein